MKKPLIGIGTLLLVLACVALGQRPARERPAQPGQIEEAVPPGQTSRAPAAERQDLERSRRLQQQIDEINANHQSLIERLKAIQATATKEQATETARQIETLIAARQAAHQEALRPLELQQQQLQRAIRGRPSRSEAASPRGRQAPAFELNSFDGKTIKLADYKGQVVVLEWINLECPFVMHHYKTVPTMAELAKKYGDKGVIWLAVNSTAHTTPEANREFVQQQKLPYPILDDRSGRVGRQFGARTTPHMFVIDRNGVIAYDGAIDNAPLGKQQPGSGQVNYVDKALAELLADQRVSLPNTPPYGCSVKYAQ